MHVGAEAIVRARMESVYAGVEEARLARMVGGRVSLRAQLARSIFYVAVAVDRDAAWCAVWDAMEAPKSS